jgi:hypothetical protein
MVIDIELDNTKEMVAAASQCGLNAQDVSGKMIEALAWAELIMLDIG